MTADETTQLSAVRSFIDGGSRVDRAEYRSALGELFGADAASVRTLAESVDLAETRGRVLRPGPFVAAAVVADALDNFGSADQKRLLLEPLLSGDVVVSLAVGPQSTPLSPLVVGRTATGYELNGSAEVVQYGLDADVLLVAAASDDGRSVLIVPTDREGVEVVALDALDGTRGLTRVTFAGVALSASDLLSDDPRTAEHVLQRAIVLSLAETIGAMDELFTSALAYSKSRFAFGRPIGSFQVIKHSLVDASLALESSKALQDALLDAVVEERTDAAEIASIAKSYVAHAGIDLAHIAWQTYGGIAYTWANDFHLYLRRITSDAALFGDSIWHNSRIEALHAAARHEEVSA